MSQKSEKVANDKGKKEPRAPGSKAKNENLPELTHTGWREWDENMATLQEYFRDTYQDLHTIFPDPLRLTTVPAYKIFTALDPTAEQLANFTDENDPDGDRKKYFLDMFKERRQAALKQQTTQLIDREKASPDSIPVLSGIERHPVTKSRIQRNSDQRPIGTAERDKISRNSKMRRRRRLGKDTCTQRMVQHDHARH